MLDLTTPAAPAASGIAPGQRPRSGVRCFAAFRQELFRKGVTLARPVAAPLRTAHAYAAHVEENGLELTQVLLEKSLRVGWLKFTSDGTTAPASVVVRTLPAEPTTAAAQLYAVLHELDDANLDRILVFLPPDTASWSAIRDRLRRASS